jgi:hypothetical protein
MLARAGARTIAGDAKARFSQSTPPRDLERLQRQRGLHLAEIRNYRRVA